MAKFGFDGKRFYKDLVQQLIPVINSIAERKYREAVNGLRMQAAKEQTDIEYAKYEEGKTYYETKLWFYALAVIDSFGTGVNMDTSSRYLSDYMKSSLWNTLRTSKQIVGREKGPYTNIFGEDVESEGRYAGRPVPLQNNIMPSYAIQNMEKWIIKNSDETEMEEQVRDTVIYFIQNNAHKYFKSGGK